MSQESYQPSSKREKKHEFVMITSSLILLTTTYKYTITSLSYSKRKDEQLW